MVCVPSGSTYGGDCPTCKGLGIIPEPVLDSKQTSDHKNAGGENPPESTNLEKELCPNCGGNGATCLTDGSSDGHFGQCGACAGTGKVLKNPRKEGDAHMPKDKTVGLIAASSNLAAEPFCVELDRLLERICTNLNEGKFEQADLDNLNSARMKLMRLEIARLQSDDEASLSGVVPKTEEKTLGQILFESEHPWPKHIRDWHECHQKVKDAYHGYAKAVADHAIAKEREVWQLADEMKTDAVAKIIVQERETSRKAIGLLEEAHNFLMRLSDNNANTNGGIAIDRAINEFLVESYHPENKQS
jgi:hypothetical protein